MQLEFSYRNNTLGPVFPTFQERVNNMLPTEPVTQEVAAAASTAPALTESAITVPHILNEEEIQSTLSCVETEAQHQNQNIIQIHSGLDADRVARLLGLLD